jgi:peptidyl-prolyl cis-trans isomerase D
LFHGKLTVKASAPDPEAKKCYFNEHPRGFACFPQFVHNHFSAIFALFSKKPTIYNMSIIQKIRDKAAWLVFGLIAVSLIGFLLMDASVGGRRMAGSSSGVIGSVNGEKLDFSEYQKQVSEREDQYKSQGYPVNDMLTQNIREDVWKQFEEGAVLQTEYEKLGIDVGDKELNDMLVGPNAVQEIKRAFTDPKTGEFDAQQAASRINQLRALYKGNRKSDQNYAMAQSFFEQALPQFVKMREREKYISLIAQTSYVPKWMIEKTNADNSQISSIHFVKVPYQSISDSTIHVSDAEIQSYLDDHKNQFAQEESRSISYVSFSAAPTSGDSTSIFQQVQSLKPEFTSTRDVESFLAKNGTEKNYSDVFVPKSKISGARKDSVSVLPVGAVTGPYLDGTNFELARIMEIKTLPDSVHARHILVAINDPKTNQPKMDDSSAKRKVDSLKALIDRGRKFDSIAFYFSDDEGSRIKGGDLGYFGQGQMVKEFGDFAFNGKKGDVKIVKTQFGYHLVEILDQKNFEPAYKIAYFARRIEPSQETDQNASGFASQFAGENRDKNSFDAAAKKGNLNIANGQEIKPTDFNIQGIGSSRSLVRWIYSAKAGEVSESFPVGDKYVVALVTEINQKGTVTLGKAKPMIEPILRNQKKEELIAKKIGSASSLETVASVTGQPISKADSLQFSSPYIPNVGLEPKVIGYSFDKQLAGKPVSSPVGGNDGVFVIKVENVSARANYNVDLEQARRSMLQTQESIIQRGGIDALKKKAKTQDDRGKFL